MTTQTLDDDQVRELHAAGHRPQAIADQLGTTYGMVYRRIRRMGLTPANGGQAAAENNELREAVAYWESHARHYRQRAHQAEARKDGRA